MTVTSMASVSSSSQLIQSIEEAVALRSGAKLESIPRDVFVAQYYADAAGTSLSSQQQKPCARLHDALCGVCSGGTISDGVPSVGLGVLSAAWKHLMVPTVLAAGPPATDGKISNTPGRSDAAHRLIQFVFDRVRESVLSHDWENEKDVQLSKFFASYLVAVVKAQPSIAFEAIAPLVFQLYGVVAAAIGGGGDGASGKQLHSVVLVRLETVLATMGASPNVPLARKCAAMASFAQRGTLESDVEVDAPSPLFGAVVAHIMVATLKEVPLSGQYTGAEAGRTPDAAAEAEDRHAALDLWAGMLMWLPEASLPGSPLRRWYEVAMVASPQSGSGGGLSLTKAVAACCYQGGQPSPLASQLFTTAAVPSSAPPTPNEAAFAHRWLLVTSRFVADAQNASNKPRQTPRSAALLVATLTMSSHPLTAERIIALWVLSLCHPQPPPLHRLPPQQCYAAAGPWLLAGVVMRTCIGALNKYFSAVSRRRTTSDNRQEQLSDLQLEHLRHIALVCACIMRQVGAVGALASHSGNSGGTCWGAQQLQALASEAMNSTLTPTDAVRWVLQQIVATPMPKMSEHGDDAVAPPGQNAATVFFARRREDGASAATTLERLFLLTELSGAPSMAVSIDDDVASMMHDALTAQQNSRGGGVGGAQEDEERSKSNSNGDTRGEPNQQDDEVCQQVARIVKAASVVQFPVSPQGGAALHAVVKAAARLLRSNVSGGGVADNRRHDVGCAALRVAGLVPPLEGPGHVVQLTAAVRMLVRCVFSDAIFEATHGGASTTAAAYASALHALRGFAQHTRVVAIGDLALDERIVKAFVGMLAPLDNDTDIESEGNAHHCGQFCCSDLWSGTWSLCSSLEQRTDAGKDAAVEVRTSKRPRGTDDDDGRQPSSSDSSASLADAMGQCVSLLQHALQRGEAAPLHPERALQQLEQLEGQVGLVKQRLAIQHHRSTDASALHHTDSTNSMTSTARRVVEVHEIDD